MKVILVDDEPIALEVMESLLSNYEDIHILGRYTQPLKALEEMKDLEPDVAFLDIEMGSVSGLEMGELLLAKQNHLEIVFVTAHSQYAIDAFEINAIDYLLKPVSEKRFEKTIKRVRKRVKAASGKTEKGVGVEKKSEKKLRINSLGSFQVLDSQGEPIRWRTRKAKELFAYLWMHREKAVDKTVLMEAIFPDKNLEQAATLLHTTVYQLRNALKRLDCSYRIIYLNGGYQLQIPCTSDLDELRNLLAAEQPKEEQIYGILRIYHGDFLEEGYSWAIEAQQRYRDIVLKTLEGFATSWLTAKQTAPPLKDCLDLAYKMDPFGEEAAKLMVRYYGEQANKPDLVSFYHRHTADLRAEMDIEPPEDLKKLYSGYL